MDDPDSVLSDPSSLDTADLAALADRLEEILAEVRTARRFLPRLFIRSRGQVRVVNVDEIDWIEADAKYSRLHARDATHRVRESISAVQARLDPAHFARIHRSAIVNLDRVTEVVNLDGRAHAVLENGVRVPMSRSQKLRLLELAGDDV